MAMNGVCECGELLVNGKCPAGQPLHTRDTTQVEYLLSNMMQKIEAGYTVSREDLDQLARTLGSNINTTYMTSQNQLLYVMLLLVRHK